MSNLIERLKQWYDSVIAQYETDKWWDIYFVEGDKIKLPFYAVEEIINEIYGTKEYCENLEEMLSERDDFVRLLRKENNELRGNNYGSSKD